MNTGPRAGFLLIGVLATFALVGLSAGIIAVERVERHRALERRLLRIQARELALAAQALTIGETVVEGAWTLRHERDPEGASILMASGPRGIYRIQGDAETWIPEARRP